MSTEPSNAELAQRLLRSCRLPGYDPDRDEAPIYPAIEGDVNTIGNALLAAIAHAMLAIAESVSGGPS